MTDDTRVANPEAEPFEAAREQRQPAVSYFVAGYVGGVDLELHINLGPAEWDAIQLSTILAPLITAYPKVTKVVMQRQAHPGISDLALSFAVFDYHQHGSTQFKWPDSFVEFGLTQPVPADPLAAARLRGAQAKRDVLAVQGDLLDADEVATRLHTDVLDVERRRSQGLLLVLPTTAGKLGFPSWQFADDGLLPGLEVVFRAIGVRDPWMEAAFFLSGNLRLGGHTPLEVLLRGDVEAVRAAAAAFGEQGAA